MTHVPAPRLITPLTTSEAAEIVLGLGRKLTNDDMTPALEAFAERYLRAYEGDFDFLLDLQGRRSLSIGQLRGVINCFRAEQIRKAKAAEPGSGLDLSSIPPGTYAVPGGSTRLKVRIDAPTRGRWAGFVFVKDGAEYGEGQRYGMQRPGETYKGGIVDALRTIAADPMAAAAEYGKITGRCAICSRKLEDEESVARGIGPICYGKF